MLLLLKNIGVKWNLILQDKIVVAHNATFDISVLKHTLEHFHLSVPSLSFACTVQISRLVWPLLQNHKLGTMADYHQISFEHHNALEDARAAAIILNKAMDKTSTKDVTELSHHLSLSLGRMSSGRIYNVKKVKAASTKKKQSTILLEESIQLYEFALEHRLKISLPYTKLAAIYEKQNLHDKEIIVWEKAISIFEHASDNDIQNRGKLVDSFYKKRNEALERKKLNDSTRLKKDSF